MAGSQVAYQRLPHGARLTFCGLEGSPEATLVQELTVDPGTGDLVLRQTAHSPSPGVFGVAFSLLNLRPDIELLTPHFGGPRWRPNFGRRKIITPAAWGSTSASTPAWRLCTRRHTRT